MVCICVVFVYQCVYGIFEPIFHLPGVTLITLKAARVCSGRVTQKFVLGYAPSS